MLDPRIYRTGLVAVAFAVILLAFSLTDQQGAVGTTLPPEAFNGQNAYTDVLGLAGKYPDRRPGSAGDDVLATVIGRALAKDGFIVSTSVRSGHTAVGTRALETVTGTRTGLTGGSIVIVSHRDSLHSPSLADLSGTAVMLELARVLAGETQHHSLVLASTSGSTGAAGATELARDLPGPIDAVIALGDLAGSRASAPVLVPWSEGQQIAPPMLRNTVAAALAAQTGLSPGGAGVAAQFAHLAFPLTTSEQGPFGARGYPAVLLSLSGERAPGPAEPVSSSDRITQLGRAVLQTVNALDGAPTMPPPSAYLVLSGKLVPAWAIRLLIGALILPVLLATIDGLARARRRGYSVMRWILWVLVGAIPFVLALLIVLGAKLSGLLVAPPGPVRQGTIPLSGTGIAVLAAVLLAVVGTLLAWPALVRALSGGGLGSPANPGAAAAVLLVMCVVALVIWVANPFAAALIIPALHLWMWALEPVMRIPRPVRLLLLLAGVAPVVLVLLYYALSLALSPIGVAWTGVLLISGGHIGVAAALEWSVVLGCLASVISIAVRAPRAARPEQTPVTVRGPINYAGPGSLGGTESALRR